MLACDTRESALEFATCPMTVSDPASSLRASDAEDEDGWQNAETSVFARTTISITSIVPKTNVQISSNHTEVAFFRNRFERVKRERKMTKAMLVSSKGVALLLNSIITRSLGLFRSASGWRKRTRVLRAQVA